MRLSKAGKVSIAMAAACAMAFPLAACGGSADSAKQTLSFLSWDNAVSYTHLTLPTKLEV